VPRNNEEKNREGMRAAHGVDCTAGKWSRRVPVAGTEGTGKMPK